MPARVRRFSSTVQLESRGLASRAVVSCLDADPGLRERAERCHAESLGPTGCRLASIGDHSKPPSVFSPSATMPYHRLVIRPATPAVHRYGALGHSAMERRPNIIIAAPAYGRLIAVVGTGLARGRAKGTTWIHDGSGCSYGLSRQSCAPPERQTARPCRSAPTRSWARSPSKLKLRVIRSWLRS
jgi:hypothetical protein